MNVSQTNPKLQNVVLLIGAQNLNSAVLSALLFVSHDRVIYAETVREKKSLNIKCSPLSSTTRGLLNCTYIIFCA